MRIAIVGIGGVGRILARGILSEPDVSSVLLLDKLRLSPQDLAPLRAHGEIEFRQLDAARTDAVARAVRGCDALANTSLPEYNFGLMRAALSVDVDYLDVASTGPRRPGGLPGILEQLKFRASFRKAGRTALLSMGLDPGMSNVLGRESAQRLDSIDDIRIRSGGTVTIRDHDEFPRFVPLYSRDAFFSDIRIRPTVWADNRLQDADPLSGEEDYEFPAPVGTQRTFLVAHEEVKTLPLYVGKPVQRVDFKYAVHPDLADALRALDRLGLMSERRKVAGRKGSIPFRAAFESVFPEPAEVADRLRGTKCLSVDVEGTRGGVRKVLHTDVVLSHREAFRRRGTTAVYYLTGTAAAIGMKLLESGGLPEPGVYPSECLDPGRVLGEWAARRLPVERVERSAPN